MSQSRIIRLIFVAVGSAFWAGVGTAAVLLRPVMEEWRRKYYREKRLHKGNCWFLGEIIKALSKAPDEPAADEQGDAHEQPRL